MRNKMKLILFSLLAVCFAGQAEGEAANKGKPVPLGDPYILLHESVYYAYGTHANDGIEVYTSTDLLHWKKVPELALHRDNSWGERWFWAPEIYYVPEKKTFYMYYSANEHICVATSDSPIGPFVQEEKKPMITTEKGIDNSLYRDEDGSPYLYFCRFNDGNNIWVAKLADDLMTIDTTTWAKCIHVSQPWEKVWPRVNEGPFVIKHKGLYYMTYSANSYESPFYGVGIATATNPFGPWTKYEKNPILQNPEDLVGVGHNSLFLDKDGQLKIVFHAHHSKDAIHPRAMYIADLIFTNDAKPALKVSGTILRPVLTEK